MNPPFKSTLCLGALLLALVTPGCSQTPVEKSTEPVPIWGDAPHQRPSCVRGVHVTAWYAGTKKGREQIDQLLAKTELNTVVIDIKEIEGDVYIPGVTLDGKSNYVSAVKDLKEYVNYLKERGIFTIARIVVFHDNKLAKMKPDWAIRSSQPIPRAAERGFRSDVWVDRKGSAWGDPTNHNVWDYNIQIAVKAAELGFQGIQFDYIRFPSDGPTKLCVYSKPHSMKTAVESLGTFLERAHKKLKPMGIELSIDVFGLVGSTGDDMGIGQLLKRLIKHVDVISPMMYPSHYAPGEYGIANPNASPYETVYRSISDTKKIIANSPVELRPYLQDFSLGIKYDAKHVRDQINAASNLGVDEWLLWNPACHYTKDALDPKGGAAKDQAAR